MRWQADASDPEKVFMTLNKHVHSEGHWVVETPASAEWNKSEFMVQDC